MGRLSASKSKELQQGIYMQVEAGQCKTQDIARNLGLSYATVRFHLEDMVDKNVPIKDDIDGLCMKRYLVPTTEVQTAIVCRYIIRGGPRTYYSKGGWVGVKRAAQVMIKNNAEHITKRQKEVYPMYSYQVITNDRSSTTI